MPADDESKWFHIHIDILPATRHQAAGALAALNESYGVRMFAQTTTDLIAPKRCTAALKPLDLSTLFAA